MYRLKSLKPYDWRGKHQWIRYVDKFLAKVLLIVFGIIIFIIEIMKYGDLETQHIGYEAEYIQSYDFTGKRFTI